MFLMSTLLVKYPIAVKKHQNQEQLGDERVYLAYFSLSQFIFNGDKTPLNWPE